MKHLKNKGFTLIELVVAITILGIILILALPKLSDLKNSNRIKKYEKYAESLMTSAKLYTDSYAKDMFGNNESGCYDIPYSKLEGKHLAKDIKVDGATCDTYASDGKTPLTYVKVLKSNQNYSYQVAIKCLDQHGNTVYEKKVIGAGICDGTKADEEGPTIVITPDSHDWYNGKKSGKPDKVTIKISDLYGMLENTKIQYAWIKEGQAENTLIYKTKDLKNKRGEGTLTTPLTTTIEVPQGVTGEYTLIVKATEVRDANGIYTSQTIVRTNKFKLDNTKPVITSVINSSNSKWTNSSVTINAEATDTHSGIKQIYYTYSNTSSATKNKDWGTNNITSVIGTWRAERNNNVYIIAEDNAGNFSAYKSAGEVKIDKTPPTCKSSGGNEAWTNGNRTLTGTCSDPGGSGCKGNVSKEYSNNINSTKESPGTVYDKVGNSKKCPDQTVKIDKTAPTITASDNSKLPEGYTKGKIVTVKDDYWSIITLWKSHCFEAKSCGVDASSQAQACEYKHNGTTYTAENRVTQYKKGLPLTGDSKTTKTQHSSPNEGNNQYKFEFNTSFYFKCNIQAYIHVCDAANNCATYKDTY